MFLDLYICFWILSSWLIFFSYLLYLILKLDNNFSYIIFSGRYLVKYWFYVVIMLFLSFYIFFIRLNSRNRVINVYEWWFDFLEIISLTSWTWIILLSFLLLLMLIFWFLLLRYIYYGLKKRLVALYIYYYQYRFFWNSVIPAQLNLEIKFYYYLIGRIMIFTENSRVLYIAGIIWPRSFYLLEPRIFKILIPYLVIFDIITQEGNISKIFIVLPWYYIYMVLRTSWITFGALFNEANTSFSKGVYKKTVINGKTYRWIELPKPEELK